jgi:hypothetical protein
MRECENELADDVEEAYEERLLRLSEHLCCLGERGLADSKLLWLSAGDSLISSNVGRVAIGAWIDLVSSVKGRE